MQWNELSWELQMKVIDKLEEKLLEETNIEMQDAMVAAIVELEIWSNSPCAIIDENGTYVAEATDGDVND